MSEKGFFARIFGRGDETSEGETRLYSIGELVTSREEEPAEQQPRGFTIERAAEIIDGLPPDVPRESALRIVSGTLAATGIEVEDLEKSTRARETNLSTEIKFSRSRQEDLQNRTEEVVRSLEEEIKKARQARDTGITEEKENVTRATASLEEVRRVRAFFGFPETKEETPEEAPADPVGNPTGDETRVFEPFDDDEDRTRVIKIPDADEPQAPPQGVPDEH